MKTTTTMEYGHWGITVTTKWDGKIVEARPFGYPVGSCGPIDDWQTEQLAIEYCRSLGGEVKGPFFRKR